MQDRIILADEALGEPLAQQFLAEGARIFAVGGPRLSGVECFSPPKDRLDARFLMERIVGDCGGIDILLLGEGWPPLAQMALPHLRRGGWLMYLAAPQDSGGLVPRPLIASLAGRGIGVCGLSTAPSSQLLRALLRRKGHSSRFFSAY